MNKFIFILLGFIDKYIDLIFISLLLGPLIFYFGVYALLGNRVMTKVDGMVHLSFEAAITNIVIGVCGILVVLFLRKKSKLKE